METTVTYGPSETQMAFFSVGISMDRSQERVWLCCHHPTWDTPPGLSFASGSTHLDRDP